MRITTSAVRLMTLAADPPHAAEAVGLRYVHDRMPGIRRLRAGRRGFRYAGLDGKPIAAAERVRVRALAIPPAWEDVWICASPHGHIQATGRDARGRKQYRYHPRWRAVRDQTKYERTLAFMGALPALRRRVAADLALPGLPRAKVLAALARLLERTFVRIGNADYARANKSFGLTTLRSRHAEVRGARIRLRFRGKGGKLHAIAFDDPRLARIVRRCRDIPGWELFQYLDEAGESRAVDSADVNDYLRETMGAAYSAKDFRTWAGTMLAALALRAAPAPSSQRGAKRAIAAAIAQVAERLGNTPAVCRSCYVHPAIVTAYLDGTLAAALGRSRAAAPTRWTRREERAVMRLLAREARRAAA